MAKVFIDNSILPKSFRKLEPSLKLTWYYVWTNCDKSGVWEIDEDLFLFENGFEFNKKNFLKEFCALIEINFNKILIIDFIKINYGNLTENYNPHKPVFRDLIKNNVELNSSLNQAYFKLVDEDEDEDEDEEEDKDEDNKNKSKIFQKNEKINFEENSQQEIKKKVAPKKEEIVFPFETEKFKAHWQLWKSYKAKEHNFKYKSIVSEQASLKKLCEMSNTNEDLAIKIINQSLENGWKGFFELKKESNARESKSNQQIFNEAMDSEIARNFRFK